MDLQGRVALITGAGSGIGEAAAKRLAKAGARIGALGRTEDELVETVQLIRRAGGEAMTLVADISKPAEMEAACKRLQNEWGRIDIVFANAGVNGRWSPLETLEDDDWDHTIGINIKGTANTIKYALPALKVKGGSVIITSSINGTRVFSNTGATIYSCTKAAQVAMAKMLAVELGPHRIRVNVICPGAIDTEISDNTETDDLAKIKIPIEFPKGDSPLTGKSPGTADQVAETVLFLASDAASHVTGTELWIDGGQSLLRG